MKRSESLKLGLAVALGFLFLGAYSIYPQVRGKELYDLMGKARLARTKGTTEIIWHPDGTGYIEAEWDKNKNVTTFYKVNAKSESRSVLFDKETSERIIAEYKQLTGNEQHQLPFQKFSFELDGKAISFSVKKKMYLYDFEAQKLREIKKPKIEKQIIASLGIFRNPAHTLWTGAISPDFQNVAYMKDYEIFLFDTETGEEDQLTFDRTEQTDFGKPDGTIYPENFWWSPDGTRLAYIEVDYRTVYKYPILRELKPKAKIEYSARPWAGDPLPIVKIFIRDIKSKKRVEIPTGSKGDEYITFLEWRKDGSEIIFIRINRWQNRLKLLAGDAETGSIRTILVEEEEAFLKPGLGSNFRQLDDGKHFLWSSERTGWLHLYLYDFQGNQIMQLTEGDWEVGRIVHVDEKNRWIYFTGYGNYGFDQYGFRIKFDGTGLTRLTPESGFHRISVDPTGKYVVDDYSSLGTPRTVNMLSSTGKLIRNLASTNIDRIKKLGLLQPELVTVKAADNVTDIHGLLFKPADFDPNKSYPLLVHVYGGPQIRMNRNIYQTIGNLARLAQLGFVVWRLDNRSTPNRGKKFQIVNYMKVGQLEVDDQAAGVQQITERPYIDGSRVGVYGHSYGGYMTLMALFRYPELYHVGVAGAAPVNFDNTMAPYTERYLRTPDANPEGYRKGSALSYVKNLKGKLLVWFGTRDINVYPQHSIRLIDRLIQENKEFEVMIYPDQPHRPRGKAFHHLNKMIAQYFVEHLKPENWEKILNSEW